MASNKDIKPTDQGSAEEDAAPADQDGDRLCCA